MTNATVIPHVDKKDIEDNKIIACLSYLSLLFLIPLLAKRESRYCQEHAKQGLIVFVASLIGGLVFWVPVVGWIIYLVFWAAVIIAFVKCLMGEFWEVPLIGQLRHKIHL